MSGLQLFRQPSASEFAYTFERLVEVVDHLLDALKLERFSIYIQDYGSPIGFRLFVKHSEKIQATILTARHLEEDGEIIADYILKSIHQDVK